MDGRKTLNNNNKIVITSGAEFTKEKYQNDGGKVGIGSGET